MPSPFPGMNPYLEQPDAWHDFRCTFIPNLSYALVPQVRPKYIVTLNFRTRRQFHSGLDEERLSFVEVQDRETRDTVTVIELLEPMDKDSGADRSQYLGKQARVFESPAHLVEIDLLRGRQRPPIDELPQCDYYVMVSRAEMRPRVELWPFRLRDPLPTIPIPLRAPDADAVLDLKAVLDRVYDVAGYEDYIYGGSPVPPLSPDDAQWSAELLAGVARFDTDTPEP